MLHHPKDKSAHAKVFKNIRGRAKLGMSDRISTLCYCLGITQHEDNSARASILTTVMI